MVAFLLEEKDRGVLQSSEMKKLQPPVLTVNFFGFFLNSCVCFVEMYFNLLQVQVV